MGKNWLIRTKSNHILGPVSKEKVLELYQNGSIKTDDEICSGNGYWFFVRETDLVDKYLKGTTPQSFNPVSEAKDVLTSTTSHKEDQGTRDDITMIGGIDLKDLKEAVTPAPAPVMSTVTPIQKKKLKSENQSNSSTTATPEKKQAEQRWVKYLGIAIFIILFAIIYFRKSILRSFFDSDVSSLFISQVYAQDDNLEKKKRLLQSEILIDDVTFKPSIGLEGFRVISSFDVEQFECSKLTAHTTQLGIILYPQELINEKFLLGIRNCVLKLNDDHPVKKWLKSQGNQPKPDAKDQEKIDFLNEILNTQFNLLTDQKIKLKVIDLLGDIPEDTHLEKLLKSYLYLMIGNITRSDNILKGMINEDPRRFYQGYSSYSSLYHRMTATHLDKLLKKLARHPADRLSFFLFTLYTKNFLNKTELLDMVDELDIENVQGKIGLSYTERSAFNLVNEVRLTRMNDERRMRMLRSDKLTHKAQSYWIWPFMDIGPLVSESMVVQVKELDKVDPLWALYLLNDEKLSDLYAKNGGIVLSRRRGFLREHIQDQDDFMLTLYKLIEIGDIDEALVQKVSLFMRNE